MPLDNSRRISGDRSDLGNEDAVREELHNQGVTEPVGGDFEISNFRQPHKSPIPASQGGFNRSLPRPKE